MAPKTKTPTTDCDGRCSPTHLHTQKDIMREIAERKHIKNV